VLPDGKVISLTGDAMRARVTKSLREEHFAPIGEAIEYSFHTFTFFARRIQKGSRMRVSVARKLQLQRRCCRRNGE
jgi:DNA-directed RNA polymerase subunit N (RpoN/RPB10)